MELKRTIGIIRNIALSTALVGATGLSGMASAGNLSLSNMPLFLGEEVIPNVFFTLDDSGSMDWDIMTARYWDYTAYDPYDRRDGTYRSENDGAEQTNGRWRSREWKGDDSDEKTFAYIYDSPDDAYSNGCSNSYRAAESCLEDDEPSPFDADWRVRSSDLNRIYYRPDSDYEPWMGPCLTDGTACADASFTAARSNPRQGEDGYDDIRNLGTSMGGFAYEVWFDDKGYSGDRPRRGDNFNDTNEPNSEIDLWDSHMRITVTETATTVDKVTYDPKTTTEGGTTNRGLNETVTTLGALSNSSACYNALGSRALVRSIFDGTLAYDSTGGAGCRTLSEAQINIADWYSYYRRRAFAAKAAISAVISAQGGFRYGLSVLNYDTTLFVEVPGQAVAHFDSHNTDLLKDLYAFNWPAQNTPLRSALRRTGEYFDNERLTREDGTTKVAKKTDPIIHSCQKNFNLLFTDGFYNGSLSGFGDKDGDGTSNTLADVAKHYYDTDLSGLDNDVVPDEFDKATHQHLVTYGVAFGVEGNLEDLSGDGWPNVDGSDTDTLPDNDRTLNESGQVVHVDDPSTVDVATTGGWGDIGSSPEKIDDMWHAAYNSKGTYANADDPIELAEALVDAIGNIADRISSASATAQNSTRLDSGTRIYRAAFDSANWSGELESFPVSDGSGNSTCSTSDPVGALCNAEWKAGELLESKSASLRQMITYNPDTGAGVAFKTLADLGATQRAVLNTKYVSSGTDVTDNRGQARLDYLRGDAANEGTATNDFRPRDGKKLGDIVHADPEFVGLPAFFYPDGLEAAAYSQFRINQASRTPMLYVGANDGALHGFNANSGEEVFAYIPNAVFAKLNRLTNQDYNSAHRYFVDGDAVQGDAYFGGAWHTVLVGTLGAGGQGVFALDVTNPNHLDEAHASSVVLWEFSDVNDADLGYTFGAGNIVRLNNNKWAVVIGNGYNNTEADGRASTTGNAVLYILDISDGSVIKKIDTGKGTAQDPTGNSRPNGLSEVTAIDSDGDRDIDYIYGGDLFGNLWKFDVSSSNVSNWGIADGNDPLLVTDSPAGGADPQPITTRPTVGRHPTQISQRMIYFGTGKYIEVQDNVVNTDGSGVSTEQTQTIYGVRDKLTASDDDVTFDRSGSNMLEQEIIAETNDFVVVSDPGDDLSKYAIDWSTHDGWYLDLIHSSDNKGRRVTVRPIIFAGTVFFIVTQPSDSPCEFGGNSILLALDTADGSRPNKPIFNTNTDSVIDLNDVVTVSGTDYYASGLKFDGLGEQPSFVAQKGTDIVKVYTGTTDDSGDDDDDDDDDDDCKPGVRCNDAKKGFGWLGRQSWRQIK